MTTSEDDLNDRIRRRAHQLWVDEGRPHGRDKVHWDMATELVAIEDNHRLATRPVAREVAGEPVEESEVAANSGEFPTVTDQSEQTYPPQRKP
jgi:hypothetical protein